MTDPNRKYALIMEHEEQFAHALAVHVLDKPRLSIWMILIPIIFVFYFYQVQKFKTGRTTFVEHYLVSRKSALQEAMTAVKTGRFLSPRRLTRRSRRIWFIGFLGPGWHYNGRSRPAVP